MLPKRAKSNRQNQADTPASVYHLYALVSYHYCSSHRIYSSPGKINNYNFVFILDKLTSAIPLGSGQTTRLNLNSKVPTKKLVLKTFVPYSIVILWIGIVSKYSNCVISLRLLFPFRSFPEWLKPQVISLLC